MNKKLILILLKGILVMVAEELAMEQFLLINAQTGLILKVLKKKFES